MAITDSVHGNGTHMMNEEVVLIWRWITGRLLPLLAQHSDVCRLFQLGGALPSVVVFLTLGMDDKFLPNRENSLFHMKILGHTMFLLTKQTPWILFDQPRLAFLLLLIAAAAMNVLVHGELLPRHHSTKHHHVRLRDHMFITGRHQSRILEVLEERRRC